MKAIIFDLFETLITEWGRFKYTNQIMTEELQINRDDFNQQWEKLQVDRYKGKLDFKESLMITFQKMNAPINEKLLEHVLNRRVETKAACFAEISYSVLTMLEYLKDSAYSLGLISNCTAEETIALKESKIYNYFNTVIMSCEVGLAKPDADIYILCCEKLGVLPKDCLFVGDGGSKELIGAKNIGMEAVQATWFIKEYKKDYRNTDGFISVDNPMDIRLLLDT